MNDQYEQNDIGTTGKRYDHVLISVSNPQTAEQSIRLGCQLTDTSSLLHIINVTTEAHFTERVASWRGSSELVMDMTHLATRLGRVAKPLAATSDSIPKAIVSAAQEIGADLVILGWFGQVTPLAVKKSRVVRRVLNSTEFDIIVLKSRNDLERVQRLVVPVHENYSKKRVALVRKLMQQVPQVLLVHVLGTGSTLQEQEAQALLDEPAQWLGSRAQTCVVRAEDVVDGILDVVQKQDMIVVGPGREWVFSRFLFGHHADRLANRAPCSVLMYKAKGRKLTAWFLGLLKAFGQRFS